jgi:acetate kinase
MTIMSAGGGAADVRERVCENLEQIGIEIDSAANRQTIRKEGLISFADSKVKVFVISTNEELAIAQDAFRPAE